jgi:O-antigen ligase
MPFSPFLFPQLDMWHGAGQYCQIGILILLAYSFFEKQKKVNVTNIPLALLTLYLGLNTAWFWQQGLLNDEYRFAIFQPLFNFICFLIFYRLSFYLNRESIKRILTFLSYSICLYLFYTVIQVFNLDTFTKPYNVDSTVPDIVGGMFGNSSHNASFLAICLPLFYLKENRFSILCALLTWVLLVKIGSVTGLLTAAVVTIFFTFFYRLPAYYYSILILGAIAGCFARVNITDAGRFKMWKALWTPIKKNFIFGSGLGMMNNLGMTNTFKGWRHSHNEFFQMLLSTGIVGLTAILYCIWEYFRTMFKDRLAVVLASCFLGFLVTSLLLFPVHLWIIAMIAIMAYSWQFVLKNEEDLIYES